MPADLLDAYIAIERTRPFEWSGLANGDCKLFVLGWAERIGFADAGRDWRGRYCCESEARALLHLRGGAIAAGIALFGPPRMGSAARRGDVGLLPYEDWHVGVICTGTMWALRNGERGIRMTCVEPELSWDLGFSA
ncbi:hypothetical protein [Rhizobium sp. Leaf386]|uniref:DUF6950 family protein n=1 Tax=Rhizobium sp. Leaf386 TaxID=1736359 RepID=UPI000712598B|nr:hypothetical protein [Rhizobium sp. Leaf386]KQS90296.1 hypothetical protein ASG50_07515 [Rhizobium sp. Leaf386]